MTTAPVVVPRITVYGQPYVVEIIRTVTASLGAPRLVVVAFQPNEAARKMLRLCLAAIRRHTPEEHELWVVDNNSPPELAAWLAQEPNLNVIYNRTLPVPPASFVERVFRRRGVPYAGSYANAVALELAAQLIDPNARLMMSLHMDTMPCSAGWLSYLVGHLDGHVRCAGVRLDTTRLITVHVLGMLFDFSLFRSLQLTFAHDMPCHDVGDGISIKLKQAGYGLWACANSLWQPDLLDLLPPDSPYRRIQVDRSFDDAGRVIFLHLGRGLAKSLGGQDEQKRIDDWLVFGREVVLA